MDDKNLDILLKKRTEEIKKSREEAEHEPEKTETVNSDSTHCVEESTVNETMKTLKKVQRGNILWKVLAIILLVGLSVTWIYNSNLQKEISDLKLEVLSLLEGGASYTYMDQVVPKEYLIQVDDRVLIHADFVMESIDTNIHYSNSGSRVYIPLENMTFELETPALTKYVKENIVDINMPILSKNGHNYLDFEVFKKLYGLKVITATDGSFAIYNDTFGQMRDVSSNIAFVKTSHGLNIISKEEEETLAAVVVGTHEDLSKIIMENGRIGYVKTSDLSPYTSLQESVALNQPRAAHEYGEKINVTWSQISEYKNNPDLKREEIIPGLDVVSPTWFSLNINGIILNEADFRYMKDAHEKGYEVWGLFDNNFKPSWTSEMLNDPVYRRRAIAQIAFYAALYDLDGVNIDYENMYLNDKDMFTQFMAELRPVLREQNVMLSVDVTIPGGSDQWSKVYDRRNIAKHVDYVMFMAYDEYWGSSPISGPVASIPWVENGIEEMLELVPNEKLILGVPLYMRVWEEVGRSVSSKAIGIKHLPGVLEGKDYESSYDTENFLNYISYREDGVLHRIWVEDESSLQKRIALMNKYDLPGIGTWSKEFINMDTWMYIDSILN